VTVWRPSGMGAKMKANSVNRLFVVPPLTGQGTSSAMAVILMAVLDKIIGPVVR
jgi:galactokinase/mevalonate kinase-like predicted kinase